MFSSDRRLVKIYLRRKKGKTRLGRGERDWRRREKKERNMTK